MIARLLIFLTLTTATPQNFGTAQERTGETQAEPRRTDIAFFEQNVRPLLASHCVKCHGPAKQESNLRLDSREAILTGGDSGPAITLSKPDESLILKALRYEDYEMPPAGQLAARDVAKVRHWIASGAVWPDNSPIREAAKQITEEDRNWWAFRPLAHPTVPPASITSSTNGNEIDRFVQDALHAKEMKPAPQATPAKLIRRAFFDVIGLPPTPAQIDAFIENDSPDAWEELIDQLLASPHYGEHWARHWLDVVRYAESDGWNQDAYRPHIWRYRDYVVNAFNNDKPWPEFVRQQLAGDEIPNDNPENLAATGYLRLGIYEYNQRDARGQWDDIMNEMTDVVADTFLGVSMACARCHDHKFDPILQRDYFALRAFFEPIEWRDDLVYATDAQQVEFETKQAAWEKNAAPVLAKIDALLKPYYDRKWNSTVDKFPLEIQACFLKPIKERNSWEHQMAYLIARQFEDEAGGPLKTMKKADKAEYERLKKELAKIDAKPKPPAKLMAATDFGGIPATTLIQDTDDAVEPGFLSVLTEVRSAQRSSNSVAELVKSFGTTKATRPKVLTTSATKKRKSTDGFEPSHPSGRTGTGTGRRTALANWISAPKNPLTNRVIVNRIWQYHFGRGLVKTPNDFGEQGQRPTHPQLLDWLTNQFVKDGYSFKRLHKRILMSATWQQSATHPQAKRYTELDPGEALLWRAPIRRLDAEQIRDAMLVASGELEHKTGGPSVDLSKPRRSLYIKSLRNRPDKFL
ncbi:MAG: PSD1 and planctomycete cytochrome C domain-containing protein, partial [Planctomycetaceae bacterium]